MTPADDRDLEHGGDDALAAEYVLGVLPADERQQAARRIETEPAFARLVAIWEAHFSQLNGAYEEVAPPEALKRSLDARLFANAAPQTAGAGGLWQSLALWRAIAAAAVAALLLVVALPFMQPAPIEPTERLVASLAADGTDVRYLAVYDQGTQQVGLSHVTGDRDAGRDFELWVIEGDLPPASLGVIPVGATVHMTVSPELREKIETGAVLAISLEPEGGSPTGQATGPIVAAGDLKAI